MKNLFIFLLISLIATYSVNPKSRSKIWGIVILIPVISLIIYGTVFFFLASPFVSGQEISMSIIPMLISGAIIYIQLKRKFENDGKVKLPIILIIFVGLSFIGSIIQYSIEERNNKLIQELDYSLFDSGSSQSTDVLNDNDISILRVAYNGILVDYPDSWDIEKEVLEENYAYYLSIEKKGFNASELMAISWVEEEVLIEGWITNTLDTYREDPTISAIEIGNMTDSDFKGINCKIIEYTITVMDVPMYGEINAFYTNGISVMILKICDLKTKLQTEFRIMEESIEFE